MNSTKTEILVTKDVKASINQINYNFHKHKYIIMFLSNFVDIPKAFCFNIALKFVRNMDKRKYIYITK